LWCCFNNYDSFPSIYYKNCSSESQCRRLAYWVSAVVHLGAASSSDDKKHSTDSKRRMYGPADMVKVFVPVSICMLLVVLCVRNIEDYQKDFFIKAPYFMYSEPDDEPTKKLLKAIINAAIFLGVIIFATFLLMCFFYFKCYTCLLVYVLVATFALFTIIFTLQFRRILQEMNVPVSVITYFFLLYNLVMVEMMAVFWKGPKGVQQVTDFLASLILLSAMVALNVMLLLPQWTSWVLLIVLALWDLCAVLSPCVSLICRLVLLS
uniref:Presenilin n=1 Tax=Heligmosomoides polygyrus TaxID=6339 RepID=A0A8L8KKV7_HELPZ